MTRGTHHVLRLVVIAAIAIAPCLSLGQPVAPIARVGVIIVGTVAGVGHMVDAFAKGLADQGFVDGKNVVIERRYANGHVDRLPMVAAELVQLKADVIFAPSPQAALAAKKVAGSIPIVFALVQDPVKDGFVASLSRPGGNMTGLTDISADLNAKRLELLDATVRNLSRVAVLYNSLYPGSTSQLAELDRAAKAKKKQLHLIDVLSPDDFEKAFAGMANSRPEGLIVIESPVFFVNRKQIADFALRYRLPAIFNSGESVEAGGLMSYGAGYPELFRLAATHVAKILRGAKPAELPVEQPTRFEFVVSQKTARALGITIPQSVLLRADRVIE
jgi:putative ABC transport system substrate-binding protein